MSELSIIFSLFLIFTGAAIFATIALYTRQSLLVAYILLGVLLGPWGMGWVDNPELIKQMSNIGIIFLLFLLGLNLQPQNLYGMFKNTLKITLFSSGLFLVLGLAIPLFFNYSWLDSLIIGAAMMFSSTIIGLKLLPTTVLHHQRMGEVIISVLLLQDIIALILMVMFRVDFGTNSLMLPIAKVVLAIPLLSVISYFAERYVLMPLLNKFDRIQEYIFLLAIGWCLGWAEITQQLGLSHEIGAFIAGVAIATSPIAYYIAECLKPLRDFFLILFFFSLGASFNIYILSQVWLPSLILGFSFLLIKPLVFWWLFKYTEESNATSKEIAVRLGQVSEFSLLVAYVAFDANFISEKASNLIQSTTMITFIISSYYIVMKYKTPIALSDKLRRD